MALPSVHRLTGVHLNAHTPSLGASPIAAAIRIPFRCQIVLLSVVAAGTITSTDCVVTVSLSGTNVPGSSVTLAVASADKGQVTSVTPTALTFANEDQYLIFTPASASGTNIPGTVHVAIREA